MSNCPCLFIWTGGNNGIFTYGNSSSAFFSFFFLSNFFYFFKAFNSSNFLSSASLICGYSISISSPTKGVAFLIGGVGREDIADIYAGSGNYALTSTGFGIYFSSITTFSTFLGYIYSTGAYIFVASAAFAFASAFLLALAASAIFAALAASFSFCTAAALADYSLAYLSYSSINSFLYLFISASYSSFEGPYAFTLASSSILLSSMAYSIIFISSSSSSFCKTSSF